MPEHYIKAEIVRTWPKGGWKWFEMLLAEVIELALKTLFVWWFFAAWFPTLGLTFWQLALPVYVVRSITFHPVGRYLDKD